MKIIFLDIDGVLIPITQKVPPKSDPGWKMNFMQRAKYLLSKEACDALTKILQDPSVWIVISSSWRHHWVNCKSLLEQISLIRGEDGQYGINY